MTRKIPSSGFGSGKKTPAKATTRQIDTTVTFLAMDNPPTVRVMPPVNLKLALMHVVDPTVSFYRYLYHEVGKDYYWVDRKALNDDQLAEAINADGVSVYVAYCAGNPAGYFEIDARDPEKAWLAYFGLLPEFHGMGIGKWLLSEAVRTAWAGKLQSLHVETCTLDAPHALALYQKLGFKPYERRDKTMTVPA
ncbi:MAG: GNAT family N-acetyltransferase [Anderseniella sp.]|jgi:GNAT superfamily N-acetyltransferase|nr:GNAT family N-acetyltransferase [Anderseniella sp.]